MTQRISKGLVGDTIIGLPSTSADTPIINMNDLIIEIIPGETKEKEELAEDTKKPLID